MSFQWSKGATIIAGATSTSYTIASTSPSDAGNYSVAISNLAGSVTSNPAVLTIIVPPSNAVISIAVEQVRIGENSASQNFVRVATLTEGHGSVSLNSFANALKVDLTALNRILKPSTAS